MAVDTKTPQNLVTITRQLRKLLPGKVVKLKPTVWMIEDKVRVELNYHCKWSAEDTAEQHKTCNPYSINIALLPTREFLVKAGLERSNYSASVSWSGVHRSRTVNKRQDGTLNLECVATHVTKALEAYDEFLVKRKRRDEEFKIITARKKKETERLVALTNGKSGKIGYVRAGELNVNVLLNEPEAEVSYYLSCSNLTQNQVDHIIKSCLEVVKISIE